MSMNDRGEKGKGSEGGGEGFGVGGQGHWFRLGKCGGGGVRPGFRESDCLCEGGFRCPNICTGEKGGASGENTIGVVVGVGVIVGVHLAEREAPGDTCEDGGLQGSAHRDSSGRDGVVVVGAVVVVVVVVEVVKVSGDTCDEGGGRAPPTGLRWDGTGSLVVVV